MIRLLPILLAAAAHLALCAAVTLLSVPAGAHPARDTRDPSAQLDLAVAARLDASWAEIELAAGMAAIEPELLAGLIEWETGAQGLVKWACNRTRCRPLHVGHGQMDLRFFGPLLAGEGLHQDDLLEEPWGILAVGRGLQQLRLARPWLPVWQVLCVWGVGNDALKYRESCEYQRDVMRRARIIARWRDAGLIGGQG